jgi:hypothetical protein
MRRLAESVTSLDSKSEQNRKLEAEATVAGLSGDLGQARERLQNELAEVRVSPEEATAQRAELLTAVGQVCDDLGVPPGGVADSPLARALQIMARVRELKRSALRGGVNQAFTIGCSL